jgi:o-succinylbenzoate synthase
MKDKTSWFIRLTDTAEPGTIGIGECGPLPGLSVDHRPDFQEKLSNLLEEINRSDIRADHPASLMKCIPPEFPSVIFGLETALLDLRNGGNRVIFDNAFITGKPISINGLIWMGETDFMMDQINKKVAQGFTCIKIKVGGLDFDKECDILSYIRRRYFRENITIRLDANGAFKAADVLYKLDEMSRFQIHSIEQPLKAGAEETEELCRKSPIPVAFDEELIGICALDNKISLLKKLKPRYIVLKPTLHGGIRGCEEWISVAESSGIGWWITSALESSIGLNAICQFAGNYRTDIPQGLGTGAIYENNIQSPLVVENGQIFYDASLKWDARLLQE